MESFFRTSRDEVVVPPSFAKHEEKRHSGKQQRNSTMDAKIRALASMGFTAEKARDTLKESEGNIDDAIAVLVAERQQSMPCIKTKESHVSVGTAVPILSDNSVDDKVEKRAGTSR